MPLLYPRWQTSSLKEALKTRRVVVLSGPRQCGKTTLSRTFISPNTQYRTLDESIYLKAAQEDPEGFVQTDKQLMIIDEIQRVPDLLRAIKERVDKNNEPGQYLLTGSTNIQSLPSINESLAGRVSHIRLRPLAIGERYKRPPIFIKEAFQEKFYTEKEGYTKDQYIKLAFLGGYPEVLSFKEPRHIKKWHKDYIGALLERDLKLVINFRRKDSMRKLMTVLASWSSKFIDLSQIRSSLSIERITLDSYINALETLYLVERLPAWTHTDYERVSKRDKIFMTDTGVMASILDWKVENTKLDSDRSGKLFETFVFNQLSALIDAQQEEYHLYHYRDRLNREVDFILQNEREEYLGIEVKSGSSISKQSFKHMQWFKENMVPGKRFIGIVLYSGREVLRFGEGMWAVPINALWGSVL